MKPVRVLATVMLSCGALALMSILLTSTIYARKSATANSANSANASWQIETVDSGDVGDYTSLALDGNQYPHIAYFDRHGHSVRYAFYDVSGWHTTTVDTEIGAYDTWPQVALESTPPYTAHILYSSVDVTGTEFVKYAKQIGASWVITTVDRGGGNSIALDPGGNPHIVYIGGTTCSGLKYASLDNGEWHTSTVDPGCYLNRGALVMDQDGNPHVAYGYSFGYGSGKNNELRYAYKTAADWITFTVDSDQQLASAVSLALEPTSPYTAHISYNRPGSNGAFRYADQSASSWHTTTVGSTHETGTLPSLTLDGVQVPHVSYYEMTNSDLKYAFMSTCGWQVTAIDSGGSVGANSSLKLEPTAPYTAHVSYYDLTNHSLKYAHGFSGVFDHCTFMPLITQ